MSKFLDSMSVCGIQLFGNIYINHLSLSTIFTYLFFNEDNGHH